jgi:type VI protein secretion system component Hcp
MGGLAAGTLAGLPTGVSADDEWLTDYDQGAFMYLSIQDVDTASVRNGHGDAIPGFAWGWRVLAPGSSDVTSSGLEPLYFRKDVDQATPQLLESVATAKQHDWAVLTLQQPTGRGTGGAETVLTITMEDVRVVSLSMEGRVSYDGTHPETIELVFRQATVEHTPSGYAFQYAPFAEP